MRIKATRIRAAVVLGAIALLVALWWTIDRVGLVTLRKLRVPEWGREVTLLSNASKVAFQNRRHVWICDSMTGKALVSVDASEAYSLGPVAISSSGNQFAAARGGSLSVFNLTDGAPLWSEVLGGYQLSDVRFFPSGKFIAACEGIFSAPDEGVGQIYIFHADDGRLKTKTGRLPLTPMQLAISADERWLCALFNYGGLVFVWSLPDMVEVRRFGYYKKARAGVKCPDAASLDISPDGALIAVGGQGAFGVWRLDTGRQILAVAAANVDASKEVFHVRFHPFEPRLYVVSSDTVQTWNQEGEGFVQSSTRPVRLKDRYFTFADDAPILCVIEHDWLTLYRLPEHQP